MAKIKGCIFDLDGVIVETSRYHFLAWARLGTQFGVEIDEEVNESLKGVSRRKSLETIINLANVSLTEEEKVKYETLKNGWYLEYLEGMSQKDALPGVVEFLEELKVNEVRIGLGSSSKNAKTILKKLDITNYFDAIIDGNDVTEAKPNPEIFLKGASALSLTPSDCIVFEDAISGVEAAINGGFRCIGVGNPKTLRKANFVIESMSDFSLYDLNQMFNQ